MRRCVRSKFHSCVKFNLEGAKIQIEISLLGYMVMIVRFLGVCLGHVTSLQSKHNLKVWIWPFDLILSISYLVGGVIYIGITTPGFGSLVFLLQYLKYNRQFRYASLNPLSNCITSTSTASNPNLNVITEREREYLSNSQFGSMTLTSSRTIQLRIQPKWHSCCFLRFSTIIVLIPYFPSTRGIWLHNYTTLGDKNASCHPTQRQWESH